VLADVIELNADVRADLTDDLASMERELSRPEPRRRRLAEWGRSVRNVLEQGTAALGAIELAPHFHKAIETISSIDWSQVG
jgi:hypothetical protein